MWIGGLNPSAVLEVSLVGRESLRDPVRSLVEIAE
jgi:hypothetical protein